MARIDREITHLRSNLTRISDKVLRLEHDLHVYFYLNEYSEWLGTLEKSLREQLDRLQRVITASAANKIPADLLSPRSLDEQISKNRDEGLYYPHLHGTNTWQLYGMRIGFTTIFKRDSAILVRSLAVIPASTHGPFSVISSGIELLLGTKDETFTTLDPSHLSLFCNKYGSLILCDIRPAFHKLPVTCIDPLHCLQFITARNAGKFSYYFTEQQECRLECEGEATSIIQVMPGINN